MSDNNTSGWHLDKRFPVAMLIGLAVQLAGLVWFASQISFSVEDLTGRLAKLESERDNNRDRLVKIEAVLDQQTKSLLRIEANIERAFPRRFERQ